MNADTFGLLQAEYDLGRSLTNIKQRGFADRFLPWLEALYQLRKLIEKNALSSPP
ncbi:hypothetical protein [Chromatium okenii]|jgi:hypothetical protein|uniref:hypothetical protein n=1 Tax=Chromatium okenii TaxID=61644 RepID=UPI0026ED221E|nr:hypothetical protein [Chromatium okenii]MBV5311124.1 hypothetical protein [Chromatium okenii]